MDLHHRPFAEDSHCGNKIPSPIALVAKRRKDGTRGVRVVHPTVFAQAMPKVIVFTKRRPYVGVEASHFIQRSNRLAAQVVS